VSQSNLVIPFKENSFVKEMDMELLMKRVHLLQRHAHGLLDDLAQHS